MFTFKLTNIDIIYHYYYVMFILFYLYVFKSVTALENLLVTRTSNSFRQTAIYRQLYILHIIIHLLIILYFIYKSTENKHNRAYNTGIKLYLSFIIIHTIISQDNTIN